MRPSRWMLALILLSPATAAIAQTGARAGAPTGPLREVPFTQVRVNGGFWAQRQDTNRQTTVWANFAQCEQTGRIANFELAAAKNRGEDIKPDQYQGYFFNDSDVYKAIEGASCILANSPDDRLETYLDNLIATIAAAQQPDGYLNTFYTIKAGLDQRFTNLKDMHELYCAGHLIEAAIAHEQATGKTVLLDAAIRYADLIDRTFGPGPAQRRDVCGHPEIELALIRLWKATEQEKYLTLAEFFVDQHGKSGSDGHEPYGDYFQDYLPIADMEENKGHAVRAMYLYCAATDIAALTGDKGYIDAMDRLWDDLTFKKMYVTGGIGSNPATEGFGPAYDLPNKSAYAETCAGIGLAMWAHRMNLLHADAKYVDVMERVLYNGIASGVSLSGNRFFYDNPLESDGHHHRPDWYACACCPPNILRLVASLGSYIYAQTDDMLVVNLFVDSEAEVTLNGERVRVVVQTDYPWSESASIGFETDKPVSFRTLVRVPQWCRQASFALKGNSDFDSPQSGYWDSGAHMWSSGSGLDVHFSMPIHRIAAHPMLTEDRAHTALQRGPMLFALEGADNRTDPRRIALPPDAHLAARFEPDTLGGVSVIRGRGLAAPNTDWSDTLYAPSAKPDEVDFTAIPYFAWDNREAGPMTVWLPESPGLMDSTLDPNISAAASHCYDGDTPTALFDGVEPKSSADEEVPRFTWWPRQGTTEWAQLDFARPRRVRSAQVYWFSDAAKGGGCAAPTAWRLLYKDGDAWKPVPNPTAFGTAPDQYNKVRFDTIETTGLRLEADLAEDKSAGILEWKIN